MEQVNGFYTDFWCYQGEKNNEIGITIAVKGGIVKSLYRNQEEIVKINPAAGSIFLHALNEKRKSQGVTDWKCKIGRNGIYFSLITEKWKVEESLGQMVQLIYESQITEEEFLAAKQQTINSLKQNFRHEMTRSWYYMFEFTDIGKRYTYNEWARALETIQYDEFHKYIEELVNPQNSVVIANGEMEEWEVTSICAVLRKVQKSGTEYIDYGYVLDENGILDCHLKGNMDCDSLGALYFVFPDANATPTEKIFLLLYINEMLFREHGIVSVDAFDASIVYYRAPIREYRVEIENIWTEENVLAARRRLLQSFDNLIKDPIKFGVYEGELLFSGVDISQLIRYIQICDFEVIYRAYKNANVKIGNGAIINKGGIKNGRTTGIKTK